MNGSYAGRTFRQNGKGSAGRIVVLRHSRCGLRGRAGSLSSLPRYLIYVDSAVNKILKGLEKICGKDLLITVGDGVQTETERRHSNQKEILLCRGMSSVITREEFFWERAKKVESVAQERYWLKDSCQDCCLNMFLLSFILPNFIFKCAKYAFFQG